MRDDGSLPPDNPFVGRKDYKPYIFAMGFRNQLGLTMNPYNGEIWAAEQGPNGGDEVNVIQPGKNYGWPFASYGRDYLRTTLQRAPRRDADSRSRPSTGCRRSPSQA